MSGFAITRLVFSAVMTIVVLLCMNLGIDFVFPVIGLVILFFTVITIGAFRMRWNFFFDSVCSGTIAANKIAITFDDGPHPVFTAEVLEVLRAYHAKATFFCIGNKIKNDSKIIERMVNEGHQVANHSFNHSPWIDFYSYGKMKEEFEQTQFVLQQVTGKPSRYFRPPYGVTTPTMAKVVEAMGLKAIGWNKRSFDTIMKNEEKVLARVTKGLKEGDIILFHDTNPRIIPILKRFLEYTRRAGLEPVTIDELLVKA